MRCRRWDPASLSTDMTLDVLAALKDLMLAQAQRVFYDKAVSEGLKDGVTAKLASGAAAMFATALKVHVHCIHGLCPPARSICVPTPEAEHVNPCATLRRHTALHTASHTASQCPAAAPGARPA